MKTILAVICAFSLFGCNKPIVVPPILENQLIDIGITTGVTTGLRFAVTDAAKRSVIANYIDVGAHSLDTVSDNPTPEELATLINSWIPNDVKAQYPELLTFLDPLVISAYTAAQHKYGNDTVQLRAFLSRVARDLETGVAPFISHP